MDKSWNCHYNASQTFATDGCVLMNWSWISIQDDPLLSEWWLQWTAEVLLFVKASSPSHPAGCPSSSRSPNDLGEGSSSPERVPQMRSVIFDEWPHGSILPQPPIFLDLILTSSCQQGWLEKDDLVFLHLPLLPSPPSPLLHRGPVWGGSHCQGKSFDHLSTFSFSEILFVKMWFLLIFLNFPPGALQLVSLKVFNE